MLFVYGKDIKITFKGKIQAIIAILAATVTPIIVLSNGYKNATQYIKSYENTTV